MIKMKKWPWVLFASILAIALWTFISVNTSIFEGGDGFDYFMYYTSYILVVGIWVLTAVEFQLSDKIKKIISVAVFALTPFFCMQISMILAGEAEYSFGIYFANIMFYIAVLAVFFAATRSMRWSAIIVTVIGFVFNLASFVVNILRGTPLIPSDFLAIGTAMQVADNYAFQLRYPIVAATIITVLVIVMIAKFSFKPEFKFKNTIFSVSGAAVALIFVISVSCINFSDVDMDVFDQYHANNTHGTLYSFYINVRKMILNKPEGYEEEKVEKILSDVSDTNMTMPENKPNIIAVMNESFADMGVIGELETSEDYMPFIRDMQKNTVKGELLVSPFGGYTCNTEFEFLTGLTMGLLPSGSTPYLQYASRQYPFALPAYLNDNGYRTTAIHPYLARCWNRQKVYNLLGFEEFVSLDNGLDKYVEEDKWEYVRNYISDRTSYKAVINRLEKKKDDERVFIFNVTMQNHGGYTYDDKGFSTVTINNLKGSYQEAEQYLSLIKESDTAFKELINYLKNYKEPTIVVMFGDHQPAVEQEFFEELYGKPLSELSFEELQKRYKVPFVIWANYDIESKSDIQTSTNYLSNILLNTANIPKNDLGNFTEDISSEIPQINGMGHFNASGEWQINNTAFSDELRKYAEVEYYMLTKKEK